MELSGFDHYELAGLAGVVVYLGSYAALQAGLFKGNSYSYAFANLVAASLVLVSLGQSFNLSSAIIQVAWITISTFGILRLYYIRNTIKLSEDERLLIDAALPGLTNDQARRLLGSGRWQKLGSGHVLANEEFPITDMHIVASGTVSIFKEGKRIGHVDNGDFIGEVTCFDGGKATGTAVTASVCRVFSIDVSKLRKIAPDGSGLRHSLEVAIANNLREKLARQNQLAKNSVNAAVATRESEAATNLLRDLDLVTAA